MSRLIRALGKAWNWIKAHPIYTGLGILIAIVGGYGTISGGVHAIIDDFNLIFSKPSPKSPEPIYALELVNVYGDPTILAAGVAGPKPVQVLEVGAIVANQHEGVSITIGRGETRLQPMTSFNESKQLDLPQPVGTIRAERGINIHVPVAYVPIENYQADMFGRIDWVIKFGPTESAMSMELPISGAIFHNIVGGERLFTWQPDGASAKPVGMKSAIVRQEAP